MCIVLQRNNRKEWGCDWEISEKKKELKGVLRKRLEDLREKLEEEPGTFEVCVWHDVAIGILFL